MTQFKVVLHRYRNGEGRFSNPCWLMADDFNQCVRIAEAILTGLCEGDPVSKYSLNSIEVVGQRGIECNGTGMFETMEELQTRLSVEKEVLAS